MRYNKTCIGKNERKRKEVLILVIRERYSDHVHSNEILSVLSLNGTPACLLDLRHQTAILNPGMQTSLQLEESEMPFAQWIQSFQPTIQKEIHYAMHRLMTEGVKETTINGKIDITPKFDQCQMVHLTNGQIAFTMKASEDHVCSNLSTQPLMQGNDDARKTSAHPRNHLSDPFTVHFSDANASKHKYRMTHLVDKFPHGLAMISHNWDIIYANPKMEELTGYLLKDYSNCKLWDLYEIEEYYHFFQHFLRAMETQETVEFEGYTSESKSILQMTVHPTELGITVFAQDVTEYKQQLQALRDSEERFAILANNIKDVFWITGPNLKQIHYISPSFQSLFGVSRREAISNPEWYEEIIHEDDVRMVHNGLDIMKKQKHEIEYRIKRSNGEVRWIQTKGFPIDNHGDNYVIGLHGDITECKEMIRLKEKSQQLSAITQMSAGIAHEIKNPLTAIKGFLQIGAANPDLRDNYQEIILDEVNRIEAIVQDFMMISKPKSSLQLEKVDPESIIQYVLRLLKPEAELKDIQCNFHAEGLHETIETEPKRLNQILINLVKNSIDAVDIGGSVSIQAELSSQELTLSVSDNGPGLSEQELAKIGEPFFTTKEKGTGLGVMVTKKIVGDLNGTISYQSEKGVGTKVVVRLPR